MGKIIITEQKLKNIISNAIREALENSSDLQTLAYDFLCRSGVNADVYCRNLRKFAQALGVQFTRETKEVLENAAYMYMRD